MRNTSKSMQEFDEIYNSLSYGECADYLYEIWNAGLEFDYIFREDLSEEEENEKEEWYTAFWELMALARDCDETYPKYKASLMAKKMLVYAGMNEENRQNVLAPTIEFLKKGVELKDPDCMYSMASLLLSDRETFDEEICDLFIEAIDWGCCEKLDALTGFLFIMEIPLRHHYKLKKSWVDAIFRYMKVIKNDKELHKILGFPEFTISLLYNFGCEFIPSNQEKRIEYLKKSADLGHPLGMIMYGGMLLDTEDSAKEVMGIRYILGGIEKGGFVYGMLGKCVYLIFSKYNTTENINSLIRISELYKDKLPSDSGDDCAHADGYLGVLYSMCVNVKILPRDYEKSEMYFRRALKKEAVAGWRWVKGSPFALDFAQEYAKLGLIDEKGEWLGRENRRETPVILNPDVVNELSKKSIR